jgi:hypothetical protein
MRIFPTVHLDDLLDDGEPEGRFRLCLGRETVDGNSVAPSPEQHVQVAFSRAETRSNASTFTRRPPRPARPRAPIGRGTASNDGTTGAAKLDRPGKPTMRDKPRIILHARHGKRGLPQGDADSSGTQILIPLELMLPDRGNPVCLRVKRNRCNQWTIKDRPCKSIDRDLHARSTQHSREHSIVACCGKLTRCSCVEVQGFRPTTPKGAWNGRDGN